MPRVRLPEGGWLHVDEQPGEGIPLVLVHGVLDTPRAWDAVAGRLHRAGRRVLLVHERGHGESSPWTPGASWTPEDAATDLEAVLRALAPDGAHLVGHSRGGTAASWCALNVPKRVRSLALVCSPPHASEAFRAHFRKLLPTARDGREREAFAYLQSVPDDAFPGQALQRFQKPSLVVEAEDDPLYSPTHTMFWRLFQPYASFERTPGGHRFFAEDDAAAAWLAARLLRHVGEAEAPA